MLHGNQKIIISIHASRGGSDIGVYTFLGGPSISIHASRGGSDRYFEPLPRCQTISIHASRGGSDESAYAAGSDDGISIHASRGGSDHSGVVGYPDGDISIHASRGGSDPAKIRIYCPVSGFQSTLPAGEATVRSSCPLMTARSSMGSANRVFPVFYQRFPCSFSFGRWGFALTGSWCHWGHILSLFLYE